VVDVDWRDETTLKGRIACEWNEYESAMVDNGPLEKRPSSNGKNRMTAEQKYLLSRKCFISYLNGLWFQRQRMGWWKYGLPS
jgi:hypothetical protein